MNRVNRSPRWRAYAVAAVVAAGMVAVVAFWPTQTAVLRLPAPTLPVFAADVEGAPRGVQIVAPAPDEPPVDPTLAPLELQFGPWERVPDDWIPEIASIEETAARWWPDGEAEVRRRKEAGLPLLPRHIQVRYDEMIARREARAAARERRKREGDSPDGEFGPAPEGEVMLDWAALNREAQRDYVPAPRVAGTPDLSQFQDALPRGGRAYCGPSAASNAIVWLADHGFPNLLDEGMRDGEAGQLELVRALAAKGCMGTGERTGTGPTEMVKGLIAYAKARGYEVDEANYQGWKDVPEALRAPAGLGPDGHADPARAFENLRDDTIVLLHLGWYRIHPADYEGDRTSEFTRLGGHWVTLVGRVEPVSVYKQRFIIHDPADIDHDGGRTGGRDDFVTTGTVPPGGHLYHANGKTLARCEGIHSLGGDLRRNKRGGATTTLLDGILVFRLRPTGDAAAFGED